MMIRRNLTTREIWSYYWKEKNKNSKKQLTNKTK